MNPIITFSACKECGSEIGRACLGCLSHASRIFFFIENAPLSERLRAASWAFSAMDLQGQLEFLQEESSNFLDPEESLLWKGELLSKKISADRYEKLAGCMDCTPEEIPALIQKHAPWNGREACDSEIRTDANIAALSGTPTIQKDKEIARLRYLLKMASGVELRGLATGFVFSQGGDLYAHKFRHEFSDTSVCGYRPRGPYQPLREEDLSCPDCIDVIQAIGLAEFTPRNE